MQTRMSTMVKSIRENGEMKRATWDPANITGLNGWPLRNYLWWREKKGYDGPENFCHFMRVAMIWAPLRRVGSWVDKSLTSRRFLTAIILLDVVWVVLASDDLISGLVTVLIGCSAFAGVLSAIHYSGRFYSGKDGVKWLNEQSRAVRLAVVIIGLPAFVVMMAVFGMFELLVRAWPAISRGGRWFFGAHPPFAPWLRPWVMATAAVVVLAPFSVWALMATQIILMILLSAGVMVAGGWWANRRGAANLKEKELAKQRLLQKDREMFLAALFSILHPKWEADEARFAKWLSRYKAWYLEETGNDIDTMRLTQIAYSAPWPARLDHYDALSRYEQHRRDALDHAQVLPQKARRQIVPLGVVTFFQLVWAFVVTNKWKICPIISIPTPQES